MGCLIAPCNYVILQSVQGVKIKDARIARKMISICFISIHVVTFKWLMYANVTNDVTFLQSLNIIMLKMF